MLQFARAQVGKPFSNSGMARSILFPRQSTFKTFYCAELVAAILKHGGLMYAFHTLELSAASRTRLFFARARTRSFSKNSMVSMSKRLPQP